MQRESYVHGNSGQPLIGKTIGALLDEVSATEGSREALVVAHQKVRWTYAELKSRTDAFASGLLALGLEPGEVVSMDFPLPLSPYPIKLRAIVRYRIGLHYGFEFLTPTTEQRASLERVCSMLAASSREGSSL